jgi:hypothetical protein
MNEERKTSLSLTLLVARIFTDHAHDSLAADDSTFRANFTD